jgi:transcription termination/antitermination protein NusG
MSHNLKENGEDVSDLDNVFDDNKDIVDKFSKDDESPVTESEELEDNEQNGSEQEIVEEEGSTDHKEGAGGGIETQEDEEKGVEGEKLKKSGSNSPGVFVSATSTTTDPTAKENTTTASTGEGATSSSAASLVPPSPVSESKFYAIRTTGGQERVVANVLQNKIKSKNIGIYSILLLENFKGYIIVEAPDANVAFQALAGVRHIRGQIRGELPFKDIEGYLVKKPVVTELAIDDTVEVIGGPFKAMKAKVTRVDYEKQEATVVLLDSPYQIPVTVDANYLKKALH